jgi:hypothetical protein
MYALMATIGDWEKSVKRDSPFSSGRKYVGGLEALEDDLDYVSIRIFWDNPVISTVATDPPIRGRGQEVSGSDSGNRFGSNLFTGFQ